MCADQLVARIKEVNAEKGPAHDKMFMSSLQGRAEWFLERDKGAGGGDFTARYREMAESAAAAGASLDASGRPGEPPVDLSSSEPVIGGGPDGQPKVDGISCPRCGALMVLRTAKRGEHAGRQFYGCSRYPKCKGIVSIEPGFER